MAHVGGIVDRWSAAVPQHPLAALWHEHLLQHTATPRDNTAHTASLVLSVTTHNHTTWRHSTHRFAVVIVTSHILFTGVVRDNTQPYNVTTQYTPLHCRHRDVTHLFTGVVRDNTQPYNVTTQHIPFYCCQGNNTAHTALLLPEQQPSTHRFTVARATTRSTPLYWCCQWQHTTTPRHNTAHTSLHVLLLTTHNYTTWQQSRPFFFLFLFFFLFNCRLGKNTAHT